MCPLGVSKYTQEEPPASGAFHGGLAQAAAPASGVKETPREERALALPPGQAGLTTRAGNAGPERVSQALNWRFSDRLVTKPASRPAPLAGARPARAGDKAGERRGPGLAHSASARRAHRESAAGEWSPGLPRGSPRGWGPRGSRELRAARGPRPGPLSLSHTHTHTVSQQHRCRLARPRSAAADRHRPSWTSVDREGARRPLPMEWRMSMEASRSVLSRDWALWNSTTAAAAILPLSHRPRPRPPTPETHARKARPRPRPPPLPEHQGSCSLCAGAAEAGRRVRMRAGERAAHQRGSPAPPSGCPRTNKAVPNHWSPRLSPQPPARGV